MFCCLYHQLQRSRYWGPNQTSTLELFLQFKGQKLIFSTGFLIHLWNFEKILLWLIDFDLTGLLEDFLSLPHSSLPISAGGPKNISMLPKKRGLTFFESLRGNWVKRWERIFLGVWGFSESNFQLFIKYHIIF